MIPLIWLVFLLQLAIHLINTIGAKTINDLLWRLSAQFPTASSRAIQKQAQLRREVVRLKREMNAVSAQDDFAKWARLRRDHDKAMAKHDEIAKDNEKARGRFDTMASAARWLSTSGMRTALQFWHARTPVFEVPRGWFPWYIEWILGFPRCPYGGVSVNVWSTVCGTVIALLSDVVVWIVGIALGANASTDSEQNETRGKEAQKQKVPVGIEKKES